MALLFVLVIELYFLIKYKKNKERNRIIFIILIVMITYYFPFIQQFTKPIRLILEITIPSFIFFQIYDFKRNKDNKHLVIFLNQSNINLCNIAINIYKNNNKIVLCSTNSIELESMKEYLSNHINKEYILCDSSTNLKDKLLNISKLIGNEYTIICNEYYKVRINILSLLYKLNIKVIPTKTEYYMYIYSCIKEYIYILSLFPFTLIICYFLLFFLK